MDNTIDKTINNQSGFALILTLVVMAAMTAIGLAALTNSSTDLLITRNEKEARKAFNLAEIGIDEALSRMSLPAFEPDGVTINDRWVGEPSTEKSTRSMTAQTAGSPHLPYTFKSYPSETGGVNVVGLHEDTIGGKYEVEVDYTYEAPETWCADDTVLYDDSPATFFGAPNDTSNTAVCQSSPPDLVLFCAGFGFVGGGALSECIGAQPVMKVVSKGISKAGTEAVVKVYVVANSLNVVPPGNSILFTEGNIVIGNGANADVGGTGKVAAMGMGAKGVPYVENCGGGTKTCEDISDYVKASSGYEEEDMKDYLGMTINDLKGYADYRDTNPQSPNQSLDKDQLGVICDGLDESDEDLHTGYVNCSHGESSISVLTGNWKVAGTTTGRGLLVIEGDLKISGTFNYEGLIYVMGDINITGNVVVWGAIMVQGDEAGGADSVYINGALQVLGSIPVATSVAEIIGISKTLRWQRE